MNFRQPLIFYLVFFTLLFFPRFIIFQFFFIDKMTKGKDSEKMGMSFFP